MGAVGQDRMGLVGESVDISGVSALGSGKMGWEREANLGGGKNNKSARNHGEYCKELCITQI